MKGNYRFARGLIAVVELISLIALVLGAIIGVVAIVDGLQAQELAVASSLLVGGAVQILICQLARAQIATAENTEEMKVILRQISAAKGL